MIIIDDACALAKPDALPTELLSAIPLPLQSQAESARVRPDTLLANLQPPAAHPEA